MYMYEYEVACCEVAASASTSPSCPAIVASTARHQVDVERYEINWKWKLYKRGKRADAPNLGCLSKVALAGWRRKGWMRNGDSDMLGKVALSSATSKQQSRRYGQAEPSSGINGSKIGFLHPCIRLWSLRYS